MREKPRNFSSGLCFEKHNHFLLLLKKMTRSHSSHRSFLTVHQEHITEEAAVQKHCEDALPMLKKQEVSISGGWSNRVEFDVVVQFLQPAHEAFLRVVTISLIKVIAQLFITLVLAQSSYPICAILLNLFQNKQDRQVRFPVRQCVFPFSLSLNTL